MTFNEATTGLHEAIEEPAERQKQIDSAVLRAAFEGSRGEDQKRIAEEVVAWGALLCRKNSDYGSSVWKPPVLAPYLDPGEAIRVRMSDKIERLISLAATWQGEINEPLDDTLMDLAAYVLLFRARPVESSNA